jgi:hypothetical protein
MDIKSPAAKPTLNENVWSAVADKGPIANVKGPAEATPFLNIHNDTIPAAPPGSATAITVIAVKVVGVWNTVRILAKDAVETGSTGVPATAVEVIL